MGLTCFIRLFNTFNIGVSLSTSHFDLGNEGNILIGINDFNGKEFIKTDMDKFVADNYTNPELRFSYYFRDEDEVEEFFRTQHRPDFGFFTVGSDMPLFDSTGRVVYADVSQKTLQGHLEVKDIGDFKNEIITQVEMDEELYIKVLPSMKLLRVVAIRVEQYRKAQ
jgi:hypothetical protein